MGAGAIGAALGGRLHQAGREVVLIARGAHLEAMRRDGLRLRTPSSDDVLDVTAVATPEEAAPRRGDVALLATKTQDSSAALDALRAAAGDELPIACAQNGVANERLALRRFAHVYGVNVWLPAELLTPGLVDVFFAPAPGVLDVGRYPAGRDALADQVADDLSDAGFAAQATDDVMRVKHAKLLSNLGNALEAACGQGARGSDLDHRAREEARACFLAAGIDWAAEEELAERRGAASFASVAGREHGGGSSWQSLVRGTGSIEADYLNGEICLLGRLHGVPTPVNAALQRAAARMVRDGLEAGSLDVAEIEADV
ncbi:MAG TPA: 2-dehydropantoate 2-reductase N-terminal domain-containing protein [Solirubrobacteraceae bacterium]